MDSCQKARAEPGDCLRPIKNLGLQPGAEPEGKTRRAPVDQESWLGRSCQGKVLGRSRQGKELERSRQSKDLGGAAWARILGRARSRLWDGLRAL